jgi:hypothetical protein
MMNLLIWHERLLYPEEAGKGKKKGAGAKGEEGEAASTGALTERFKGLLANWRA